jgi:glucokinase
MMFDMADEPWLVHRYTRRPGPENLVPTIGIDIGGTKMAAVLLGEDDRIIERLSAPRPIDHDAMASEPIDLVRSLIRPEVSAIGVGAAGLVDAGTGNLIWGPNVAGEHVDFRSRFQAELGIPTFVDNDANLAALAEARIGASRGYRHALLLTLGTGIGGGWIVDGEVYRGRAHAGEIGHMLMVPDGARCTCGLRGCWETVCSGRRLDEMAGELAAAGVLDVGEDGAPASGATLTDAALAGQASAIARIEEMAMWLGRGVANLIAAFDPEIVVVGGGAARAGRLLLDAANLSVAANLEGARHRQPTPMVAARLAADAGAVGAAIYARESLA